MSQIQTSQNAPTQTSERFAPASVLHPNQSLYLVTVAKNNSQTDNKFLFYHNHMKKAGLLILSKLWLTEKVFPFVFGKKLQNHIRVNDWENGWTVKQDTQKIIIVYLPQYLEYLGFIMLITPILIVILRFLASKRPKKQSIRVTYSSFMVDFNNLKMITALD